jgi:hypothetical protein
MPYEYHARGRRLHPSTEKGAAMANSITELAVAVRELDRNKPIEAVVERLLEIEREKDGYRNPDRRGRRRLARRPDGVACFNYMYLCVTEKVRDELPRFESPRAVERLAVVFAELYLRNYDAAKAGAWVSKAWEPLFRRRDEKGIRPTQFAVAGLNAHINNDLPWALMQTWSELGPPARSDSPDLRDFRRVNDILESVAGGVRATLETWYLKVLNWLLGRLDDVASAFVIAQARDQAWDRGRRWSERFDGSGWAAHLDEEAAHAHEREVGYASQLILAA